MLSDRPYMRDEYPRERTSVLIWLICGIAAAALILLFTTKVPPAALVVSPEKLKEGWVWTLLAHGFVNMQAFWVIFDLIALFFLGRALLPLLGNLRFLSLFGGALIVSGGVWAGVHWNDGGSHYGVTSAILALLTVFACFHPNQRLEVLVFFVLPVRIIPKYLVLGIAAFDLLGFLIYEIRSEPAPYGDWHHSAHLAAMAMAFGFHRFVILRETADEPARMEIPKWLKREPRKVSPAVAEAAPVSSKARDLRIEVDRILDKINSQGFGALSPDEKRILSEAKDSLSRR